MNRPDTRRMTDDELAAAAAALLPTTPALPPMKVADMLDYFARHTRELQADLWILRDAIDADVTDDRHVLAVGALVKLAGLYDDATETVHTLAEDLSILLPARLYGPSAL
jgi:hypothetical protein